MFLTLRTRYPCPKCGAYLEYYEISLMFRCGKCGYMRFNGQPMEPNEEKVEE